MRTACHDYRDPHPADARGPLLIAAVAARSETCPPITDAQIEQVQAGQRVILRGGDCLIDLQLDKPAEGQE